MRSRLSKAYLNVVLKLHMISYGKRRNTLRTLYSAYNVDITYTVYIDDLWGCRHIVRDGDLHDHGAGSTPLQAHQTPHPSVVRRFMLSGPNSLSEIYADRSTVATLGLESE